MRWITTNPVYNSSRILPIFNNGNFSQNALSIDTHEFGASLYTTNE